MWQLIPLMLMMVASARTSKQTRRKIERMDAVGDKPRIAVYLRISKDPLGTSTATDRQLLDCRRFAKLRGWVVVAVYEDSDLSAFDEGVVRPSVLAELADTS